MCVIKSVIPFLPNLLNPPNQSEGLVHETRSFLSIRESTWKFVKSGTRSSHQQTYVLLYFVNIRCLTSSYVSLLIRPKVCKSPHSDSSLVTTCKNCGRTSTELRWHYKPQNIVSRARPLPGRKGSGTTHANNSYPISGECYPNLAHIMKPIAHSS